MMGLEGLYLWDWRTIPARSGNGPNGKRGFRKKRWGDMEFMVKGMHRVSQFNAPFPGPVRLRPPGSPLRHLEPRPPLNSGPASMAGICCWR